MAEKIVAITGGGQGIGKALTKYFLQEKWKVSTIDFDNEAITGLKEETESFKDNLLLYNGDVSSEISIKNWHNLTIKKFKTINVLINNAGISINKPIINLSLEEWQKVINVNLTSIFLTAKYFANDLKKQKGCIVNIASTRAFQSEPNTEAYSASKGGIISLTHAMAVSLGPDIRVNCISPGWIYTAIWKKKNEKNLPPLREIDHLQHPAGRVGIPEDIFNAIKFLISEENSFITATNLIIDGGMTKKMIYVE